MFLDENDARQRWRKGPPPSGTPKRSNLFDCKYPGRKLQARSFGPPHLGRSDRATARTGRTDRTRVWTSRSFPKNRYKRHFGLAVCDGWTHCGLENRGPTHHFGHSGAARRSILPRLRPNKAKGGRTRPAARPLALIDDQVSGDWRFWRPESQFAGADRQKGRSRRERRPALARRHPIARPRASPPGDRRR